MTSPIQLARARELCPTAPEGLLPAIVTTYAAKFPRFPSRLHVNGIVATERGPALALHVNGHRVLLPLTELGPDFNQLVIRVALWLQTEHVIGLSDALAVISDTPSFYIMASQFWAALANPFFIETDRHRLLPARDLGVVPAAPTVFIRSPRHEN